MTPSDSAVCSAVSTGALKKKTNARNATKIAIAFITTPEWGQQGRRLDISCHRMGCIETIPTAKKLRLSQPAAFLTITLENQNLWIVISYKCNWLS